MGGDNKNNERVMLARTAMNYRGLDELIEAIEGPSGGNHEHAAQALGFVRDGIITGERPTTKGRVHFSRELDAADAVWCRRILTAPEHMHSPVSGDRPEALFQIDEAASERPDVGAFDH